MVKQHFELRQTAVTMIAEKEHLATGREAIFEAREIIERFIASDSLFRDTLEPYDEPAKAHPLIKRMCDAARSAQVGPMAGVAGAIAEFSEAIGQNPDLADAYNGRGIVYAKKSEWERAIAVAERVDELDLGRRGDIGECRCGVGDRGGWLDCWKGDLPQR